MNVDWLPRLFPGIDLSAEDTAVNKTDQLQPSWSLPARRGDRKTNAQINIRYLHQKMMVLEKKLERDIGSAWQDGGGAIFSRVAKE